MPDLRYSRLRPFALQDGVFHAAKRGLPPRERPRREKPLAAGRAAGGEKKLPAVSCAAGSPFVSERTACVRAPVLFSYFTTTFVPFTM